MSRYVEWAKREIEYAKLHEYSDTKDIQNDDKREAENILNLYVDSVYDSALELLERFAEQDHSGMSASLTLQVFTKLAKWQPLSPLTGDENEWNNDPNLFDQNKRDSRVFRKQQEDGSYKYSFNDILIITNDDEVWHRYPPYDEPGSLDDDHPSVKKFFDTRWELKCKLESEITFPYIPKSYYYRWDFATETFVEEREKELK